MAPRKLFLIAALAALVAMFFVFDLGRYFSLDFVRQSQAGFAALYAQRPALVRGGFFAVYVAVTALSLPGRSSSTFEPAMTGPPDCNPTPTRSRSV